MSVTTTKLVWQESVRIGFFSTYSAFLVTAFVCLLPIMGVPQKPLIH